MVEEYFADSQDGGIGEDFGEEEEEDDSQFVRLSDLKKVRKEVDSFYSTIDSIRSMVDEVQRELKSFRSRVSDDFSWTKYQEDQAQ